MNSLPVMAAVGPVLLQQRGRGHHFLAVCHTKLCLRQSLLHFAMVLLACRNWMIYLVHADMLGGLIRWSRISTFQRI